MNEINNKDSKKVVFVIVIAMLAVATCFLVWMNLHQRSEINEIVEQMEFEKEQLEDEYEELAIQFDGYQTPDIQNDSLIELLSQEKQRVQDLLEELRITKVTNARRIAELKKELATVRQVMVSYVQQIDSLDRTNKMLVAENKQVKQQYQEVARQAQQLEHERSQLAEVVSIASILSVSDFQMTCLNKSDKKTKNYSHIQKLQFDYTIAPNITTSRGQKTIYLRIVRPDGEVMIKSLNNLFQYENAQIEYSIAKDFEYEGEEISGTMYWQVEEILQIGIYNADFFVDGAHIANYPFEIKK